MTKDETLRLALDTLKEVREETFRLMRNGERLYAENKVYETIYEIKKALETKDEPVAVVISESGADVTHSWWHEPALPIGTKLYTTPQRTWVGLTDEEIAVVEDEYIIDYRIPAGSAWNFAKDIEAKLKDKNNAI